MVEIEHESLSQEDATLLLYVAGELSDMERSTLDGRLSTDAALRDRLATMTALDHLMRGEAEARPVAPGDSRKALSTSIALVREQAIVLQSRPLPNYRRRQLAGVPRWAWGTAVAASLVVGALVWITNSDPSPIAKPTDLSQNDEQNRFGNRGDGWAMTAPFLRLEAEGTQGPVSEIDSQLDALNMLAAMDEPATDDAN